MAWLIVVGSLAFGVFVGCAAVLFMHPAIRESLALGERNKQFGIFLGIIVGGGGGGAAGLTLLADGGCRCVSARCLGWRRAHVRL